MSRVSDNAGGRYRDKAAKLRAKAADAVVGKPEGAALTAACASRPRGGYAGFERWVSETYGPEMLHAYRGVGRDPGAG